MSLRESVLRRDKYMCQISKRYGKLRQADIVHHCFPRDEFPEYEFEPWNLISICKAAHNKLHNRETNELTEEGRLLLVRAARKNGIEVPEKYQKPIKKTFSRRSWPK